MTLYPCPPGGGEEAHSTAARGLPHCGAERGGDAVPGMAPGGAAPEPGETCGDGSHSVAHPATRQQLARSSELGGSGVAAGVCVLCQRPTVLALWEVGEPPGSSELVTEETQAAHPSSSEAKPALRGSSC